MVGNHEKIGKSPEEALTMVKKYDKIPVENAMLMMTKSIEGRKN